MLLKYSRRADEFAVASIMLLYEYRFDTVVHS